MDQRFGLKHDEFGRLVLIDSEGRRHLGVEPVRAFPVNEPSRFISLLDADGKELFLIDDLASLAEPVRSILEADLARREFIPVITKIIKVHGESHPTEWDLRTDRGDVKIIINGDDDVRQIGPRRALLVDGQGVRYLIPDIQKLDAASKRALEVWL